MDEQVKMHEDRMTKCTFCEPNKTCECCKGTGQVMESELVQFCIAGEAAKHAEYVKRIWMMATDILYGKTDEETLACAVNCFTTAIVYKRDADGKPIGKDMIIQMGNELQDYMYPEKCDWLEKDGVKKPLSMADRVKRLVSRAAEIFAEADGCKVEYTAIKKVV